MQGNGQAAKKGRLVVQCPRCSQVIAYLAEEAVKRGARLAGHGLVPPSSVLRGVLDLASLRCARCESETP